MPTADSVSVGRDDQLLRKTLFPLTGRLRDLLHRLIPSKLRSLVDADDVVQDTFLEVALADPPFRFADADEAWRLVATIARRRLINLLKFHQAAKRAGSGGRVGAEEICDGSVVLMLEQLATHRHTPSRSAVRREFLTALERSLEQLQPSYRDVIRLRYVEGNTLKATAASLGQTEDSTQKLAVRGLRALRVQLRTMSLYL
jgi:RNA polymerase sigma factor (sigma-70 family)